jgi:hypothetical protein
MRFTRMDTNQLQNVKNFLCESFGADFHDDAIADFVRSAVEWLNFRVALVDVWPRQKEVADIALDQMEKTAISLFKDKLESWKKELR